MPPGRSAFSAWARTCQGSGRSKHDAVEVHLVDALVDIAFLHPVGHRGPAPGGHVGPGSGGEVGAQFVPDDVGPGAEQRHGERPRSHTRLEDLHPGTDVGRQEDGAEILRIDDLGAAGHLENDIGQGGADHEEEAPGRPGHRDAFGPTDDVVMGDDPRMGVEGRPRLEGQEVPAVLGVDKQDTLAGGERPPGPGWGPRHPSPDPPEEAGSVVVTTRR